MSPVLPQPYCSASNSRNAALNILNSLIIRSQNTETVLFSIRSRPREETSQTDGEYLTDICKMTSVARVTRRIDMVSLQETQLKLQTAYRFIVNVQPCAETCALITVSISFSFAHFVMLLLSVKGTHSQITVTCKQPHFP